MSISNIRQTVLKRTSWAMHPHVFGFIGYNFAAYGMYKLMSGPSKNNFRKRFNIGPGSSLISLITAHVTPTNLTSVASSSLLLFAVGSKHAYRYGGMHFWTIMGLGALGGTLLAKVNPKTEYSGPLASAAAVTFYNVIRNPGWFLYGTYPAAALLVAYTVLNQDHVIGGGLLSAYAAFLFAL